jgi:large subunit ribosomal protein L6
MSRIGKLPITIPAGVVVDWNKNARVIKVTGPLGELSQDIHSCISIDIADSVLTVGIENENDKFQKAIWGTIRSIIANLVEGVSKGFEKSMELNGVGYKMELANKLTLHIGFSHPVVLDIPAKIKLNLNKNVLSGTSIDKHLIGDFFTRVHDMKACDVYKQKGFKFPDRYYRKKVAKKTK